jgi:hypothetical protein
MKANIDATVGKTMFKISVDGASDDVCKLILSLAQTEPVKKEKKAPPATVQRGERFKTLTKGYSASIPGRMLWQKDISISEAARVMRIPTSSLSQFLTVRRRLRPATVEDLAVLLEVPIVDICNERGFARTNGHSTDEEVIPEQFAP